MIPVTAEGKPKQEAGVGWVRVPWLLCPWWIPVQGGRGWPSLFSIVLHISLVPQPRAHVCVLATCPQSQMHLCAVCSRGACSAQSITNPLLGPINKRGGRRGE